jgi:tRNA threonylcarbamoyladenosine biosynthesis protein TsaE
MIRWSLPTRAATSQFGEALGRRLRGGETIALVGDLGAGKTTLAQAIARGMGIPSHVTSPTFGIVHEYPGPIPLIHFDPYRLNHSSDLLDIGYDEYFERGGVVLIEWADRFPELLPDDYLMFRLEIDSSRTGVAEADGEDLARMLEVDAIGPASAMFLSELSHTPNQD